MKRYTVLFATIIMTFLSFFTTPIRSSAETPEQIYLYCILDGIGYYIAQAAKYSNIKHYYDSDESNCTNECVFTADAFLGSRFNNIVIERLGGEEGVLYILRSCIYYCLSNKTPSLPFSKIDNDKKYINEFFNRLDKICREEADL